MRSAQKRDKAPLVDDTLYVSATGYGMRRVSLRQVLFIAALGFFLLVSLGFSLGFLVRTQFFFAGHALTLGGLV